MTDEEWSLVRAAFPTLRVDEAAFERYAEAHQATAKHLSDLYLAYASLVAAPGALDELVRRFRPQVATHLRRDPPALVDEVWQALLTRLFVGDAPRIATYTGRGPLGAWLRTAAVRLAVDLRPRARAEGGERDPEPMLDPELDYLKERYRPVFGEALQACLAALSIEERTMLRLHFLDGMTATQIAALERVAVSTVTRALERTRRHILEETKRQVTERLGLSPGESDSMLRLARSLLDVSIRRLLEK